MMEHHPAGRAIRLAAAQKVAAMSALKVDGDGVMASQTLGDFKDAAELTLGFQVVIEALAVELGHASDRTPAQVLRDIALRCASGQAHPPAPPDDVVD